MHNMCAAHMIARIHAVAGAHVGKWLRITAIIPHIGRPMLTTHAMSFTTTKHRPHQRPKIMVAGSSVEGCSPSCHNIVCNGCFGLVGHGVQGTWSRNVHDRGRFIEGHLGWPQLPLPVFVSLRSFNCQALSRKFQEMVLVGVVGGIESCAIPATAGGAGTVGCGV